MDEARLASSGANGVLEKPVVPKIVINRVKELLGLKTDESPAPAGRLITSAAGEKKRPVTSPRPAPSTVANAPSVEGSPGRGGDYLDTLDAAFDSLDQQLSGRTPSAKTTRNPAGPIGQSGGAADPRSPGRTPSSASSAEGNPVFEVDDEWFEGGESQARADARAGRREIAEDLGDPGLQAPRTPGAPATPVYEVDDEWFAEDKKTRASQQVEQDELAKEMGIHDVEFPAPPPVPVAPPPRVAPPVSVAPPAPPVATAPLPVPAAEPPKAPEPVHVKPPEPPPQVIKQAEPLRVKPLEPPAAIAPMAPIPKIADDFEALLAFERGEREHPPAPPPPRSNWCRRDHRRAPRSDRKPGDRSPDGRRVRRRAQGIGGGRDARNGAHGLGRDIRASDRDSAPAVVFETSERLVRDTVDLVVAEASERMVRDSVHTAVAEASERAVREAVPAVVAEPPIAWSANRFATRFRASWRKPPSVWSATRSATPFRPSWPKPRSA